MNCWREYLRDSNSSLNCWNRPPTQLELLDKAVWSDRQPMWLYNVQQLKSSSEQRWNSCWMTYMYLRRLTVHRGSLSWLDSLKRGQRDRKSRSPIGPIGGHCRWRMQKQWHNNWSSACLVKNNPVQNLVHVTCILLALTCMFIWTWL